MKQVQPDLTVEYADLGEPGDWQRHFDGADVVVMGCAGMSRFKQPLEQALGIPVVDPTHAAAAMAIAFLRF